MVEDEHRCAGEPLTIELTPNGLTPAGVGNGQVEGTFMQVMPEHTCCQMSHGIEVVVGHHLRLATGTGSEVHQHCVGVVVDMLRTDELRGLLPFALPVVPDFPS